VIAALRRLAAAISLLLIPVSAGAQAFTPPARVGSVTFGWQWVDNTGHIGGDGTVARVGQSVTTSLLAEIDYGVTERFAATASVPFVFAKYTGQNAPISGLERDSCRCWHQSFQDFSVSARYRFGDEFWALTPQLRYVQPSHDYPYHGEAVVGQNLTQLLLGMNASWRVPAQPKASIQASYNYTYAEQTVDGIRPNRSNLAMSFGYALTRSLYVHGGAAAQKNYNGLTIADFIAKFLSGSDPDQVGQADRLLKMRYWHVIGGVSYSTRFADVFFSVEPYVWGRDTHDGIAATVGSTWYFDFSKKKP
jgi:hypothetical protein